MLVGDVDFARVAPRAAAITPVPGGVGPLTVAMVVANTLRAARDRQGIGGRLTAFRVGLTGGLASGKSTVAAQLAEAGFQVVDADRLVKELYRPGGPGARAVADLFGGEMLDSTGAVDARRLAARVFHGSRGPPAASSARSIRWCARASPRSPGRRGASSVLEATRLVEAGYAPDFDLLVTVEADPEVRLRRAMARGLSEAEARARLAAQGDGEERRAAAHILLRNDGDLEALRAQVEDLIAVVRRRASDGR